MQTVCGISGLYNANGKPFAERDALGAMTRALAHRGPDGEGFFEEGPVGLGHRRLSILDLSEAAHQPMLDPQGRLVISYNGEVYNYVELRDELRGLGHTFSSTGDTEVVLAAFKQWGADCVHRFNGMFAIAVYDRQSKQLFLARDRFGIKPLYYFESNGRVGFASEIKALLRAPGVKATPNRAAIADYLATGGTDHNAETCFQGIFQLKPGHRALVDADGMHIDRWWHPTPRTSDDPVGVFRDLFQDAVRLRMRSDVPVGSSLSGGLDSAAIVGMMRRVEPSAEVRTFTAVFPGSPFDESRYAKMVADAAHAAWITTTLDGTAMKELVQEVVYVQDEPFGTPSILAQHQVMRAAHEAGMKVLLDGQGSDEQLAGYTYFFGRHFLDLARSGHLVALAREAAAYRRLHRTLFGFKVAALLATPGFVKRRVEVPRRLLHPDLEKVRPDSTYVGAFTRATSLGDSLHRHLECRIQHLLRYEDRNSMAFSIETRLPFLDYRLVEAILGMGPEWKIHRGITKVVLREALGDVLPEEVRNRTDKIGYVTSEATWFREPDVEAWIRDLICTKRFQQRRLARPAAVERLLKEHAGGKDRSRLIWRLVNLELWYRRFIDAPAPGSRDPSASKPASTVASASG